jgi:hypothetical protein
VIKMIGKRTLVVGGLVVALTVPAGIAVAGAAAPSGQAPSPTQPYGPGPQAGGVGDPADCPYHDSAETTQWREQRAERLAEMRRLHGEGWTPPRDGTGPYHGQAPGPRARATTGS